MNSASGAEPFRERVNAAAVKEILSITETRLIRPTITAPVIKADGTSCNHELGIPAGIRPQGQRQKPVWRTIVNSREDKLDGRTWKEAFTLRRCLIPASSFYEWVEIDGRNVPLRFERPSDEWIWIAGIWEEGEERGMLLHDHDGTERGAGTGP